MRGQYLVQLIFALAGCISLLAALFNWEWFFSTRSSKSIVTNAGRPRARLFYGILGVVIIGMAIFFFIATRQAIAMGH